MGAQTLSACCSGINPLTIERGQEAHANLQRANLRRCYPHKECEQHKSKLIAQEQDEPPMTPIKKIAKAIAKSPTPKKIYNNFLFRKVIDY